MRLRRHGNRGSARTPGLARPHMPSPGRASSPVCGTAASSQLPSSCSGNGSGPTFSPLEGALSLANGRASYSGDFCRDGAFSEDAPTARLLFASSAALEMGCDVAVAHCHVLTGDAATACTDRSPCPPPAGSTQSRLAAKRALVPLADGPNWRGTSIATSPATIHEPGNCSTISPADDTTANHAHAIAAPSPQTRALAPDAGAV